MIGKELVGKGEVCLCLSEQPGRVTMPCITQHTGVFICGKILRQLTDLLLHASLYP